MIQLGKKGTIAVASALVLFGAVIAGVAIASGEEFDPVHAPDWQAGYSFSYDVTGSIDAVTDGNLAEEFGIPSDTNAEFGPFPVKKEILSTEYQDADGYPVYVSAATFPFSNLQSGFPLFDMFAGQEAYATAERQHDLAPVVVVPDRDCRSDGCPGGGLEFPVGNPMSYLNFPLTPEKRWEQEVDLPILELEELPNIDRMHVIGEVHGLEKVQVGDEETDAVRVDFSYTPVGLQEAVTYFKDQLEKGGLDIERFTVNLGMHEIVHYSPEYEAVVQQEYIVYIFVDIAAQGEIYGNEIDYDVYGEVTARIQALLTGADRVAGEERSPTEILSIVGDPALIADARGQGVGSQPYTISLASSADEVNAAEGEVVSFDLQFEGLDEIPDGLGISYEVLPVGAASAHAGHMHDGYSMEYVHEFTEPGVYDVVVTVQDGDSIKTASSRVAAHWFEEVDADCMISPLGTSCEAHDFPVAAGLESLHMSAEPGGLYPGLLGEYVLVDYADGDSDQFSGREAGYGAEAIEHGAGDWAFAYENQGDYLAQATYIIEAYYDAPQVVEAEPAPESGSGGSGGLMVDLLGGLDDILDL